MPLSGSIDDRYEHLFKTYVDKMFKRDTPRTDSKLYPKEDTIHWLSWLARKMSEHGQTVFLIHRMQPSWLDLKFQRLLYEILVTLVVALVVGFAVGLAAKPIIWLVVLVVLFLLMTAFNPPIKPAEILKWSWKRAILYLKFPRWFYPLGWVIIVLVFATDVGLVSGLIVGSISLVFVLLPLLLFLGLSTSNIDANSNINHGIKQSAKNALKVMLVSSLVYFMINEIIIILLWFLFNEVMLIPVPGETTSGKIYGLKLALFGHNLKIK